MQYFIPFTPTQALPEVMRSPFAHSPHAAAIETAEHLQSRLAALDHPFGLLNEPDAIGKMFGVLLVQNAQGDTGYLAAFSGKLAGGNQVDGFVPPVFDVLAPDGFYLAGEAHLNGINAQITALENHADYLAAKQSHTEHLAEQTIAFEQEKQRAKEAKHERDERRKAAIANGQSIENQLIEESKRDHFILRDLKRHWSELLAVSVDALNAYEQQLTALREARKQKSGALQAAIFEQYTFLNSAGQSRGLGSIFSYETGGVPPAGAGECAAPKLFQYAFLHGYKPLAIAEFWWGASPSTEIRKHGQYYPACRGKCEPILGHMLTSLTLEADPRKQPSVQVEALEICYEDAHVVVINKPAGLLSVPGKTERHCVQLLMQRRYPDATGPLVVHRLDQATSGLILVAKTEELYKALQLQFIKRTIKKRYVALLDALLDAPNGVIDLPLRVDLDDRPRQMVCYEHGLAARTLYQIVGHQGNTTRVHFSPITGRTHQLRVHAAHPSGLNAPIVGDDLYGTAAERLHLHAEWLQFVHPVTSEVIEVEKLADF